MANCDCFEEGCRKMLIRCGDPIPVGNLTLRMVTILLE
ncbi:hypothetical protein THTE_2515 [Thermogutta terrifontis]|uniref:Uncharacterized protein n=1 Tax=Thermogutta terrifontis TaxID=1331910 RepID=A0A286RGP4_9BACT|nr:hypothetical protein THTE_2515 [Thermogutta terrifontis]